MGPIHALFGVASGDHASGYGSQVRHGNGRYLIDLINGIIDGAHIVVVLIIGRA
jgi:hypothetical protein